MSAGRTALAAACLGAGVLAAFAGALPAPLAIAALATTFLLAPGLVAARFAFARSSRELRAGAALATAPFLTAAPLSALVVSGMPVAHAARIVALVVAAASLGLLAPEDPRAPAGDRAWRVSWRVAAAWTVLIAVFLVGNRWLPPRADGWFHAAVTLQVAERGLPPEDPYFAGLRLLYFWGMHAWAAAWLALAPKLSVWTPLIAFNLSAAAAAVLAVAALARRLGAGPGRIAFAAGLATLGYSPFTWLLPIARSMVGDVRGWAELHRTLESGASSLLGTLAMFQLHASMAFFGDKFLVLTQFGMGLALLPLALTALLELCDSAGVRETIAFALLFASALFIHTVSGYALVVLAGLAWLVLAADVLRGDRARAASLLAIAVAVAVALLVLSPYLVEITAGKKGQFARGFIVANLVSLVVGAALYAAAGFGWLAGRLRASRDARVLFACAAVLLLFSMSLKLPENNQSKFFNLLFILLPAPAAMGWCAFLARLGPPWRRAAVATIVAGAVPTALVAFWGMAAEHGQTADGWHPPTAAVTEAMDWARAHTPADAAFCDTGGGRELLDLAGRSVVWGGRQGERDWGYGAEAIGAHRELALALCRGREPGAAGAALLASLKREVIVMTRANAPDSLGDAAALAARPERFERLWSNGEVAFWKVLGR